MEAMRQSWTDDRLDDLQSTVNEFRGESQVRFMEIVIAALFGLIGSLLVVFAAALL